MDDRAFIQGFEGFHDTRSLGLTAVALLANAIVIGGIVAGFHGGHVSESANAMAFVHRAQPSGIRAPSRARVE